MSRLVNTLRTYADLRRAKHRAAKEIRLRCQAEHIIQAREYDGNLYVAFRGEPLMRADTLTADLPSALSKAREAWITYMLNHPKTAQI